MTVFVQANEIIGDVRFIDCRFNLADIQAGEQQYNEGHIDGAVYFHLERDLSDMTKKASGRHPMPDKESLLALFEEAGLQLNDQVYCYDNGGEPFATRAYWMLTYAGFNHVYIVNGGYDALVTAGYKVSTERPSFTKTTIEPNWHETIYATRQYAAKISSGALDAVLVDARAAKRYAGEFEPLDPVAGHIPGALNYDWEQLKDGSSLVVTDSLKETVPTEKEVVVYCGSGVTATPLYATLKHAGYENVRLYVGSYSDWINEFEVTKK